MKRRYVDTTIFESRSMAEEGNIDYRFWHNKTNDEKMKAAGIMTSVAFREPDFFKKKMDKTLFSSRKHAL